MIECKLKC